MTSSTRPYGNLLSYEQFIDHQLGRARARIKITDFMTAGLLLLAVLIAVLFVEVMLDHLVGLPFWSRRVVLLACASGSGTYAVLRIVYPLVRRVNGFYAARMIEEADPSFKNSLITYLDLRRRRGELSRPAMAAIEARAVYHLTRLEIDDVVDQRRLLRVVYGFSAVVVVFCLYAALSPRSILDSARRALLADLVRPTRTRLLNITPGDDPGRSRIVAGTEAVFTVEVQGARPGRVVLHASTDGGKSFASHEFSCGTRRHDPWRTIVQDVQHDIDYYVTGGDAESRMYHLEVIPAPMVTGVWLELDFPAYLNLPRRTGIVGGSVEAIEGTIVTVRARTSEPARSASLTFTQAAPASMEVSLSDPRELTGRFKVEKTGTYTINYRTTAGHRNRDPVVSEIIALPDRPPRGMFEKPERADVDVDISVDEQVEVVMKGDDDHGVRDVTLHVDRNGQTLLAKTLLRPQQPSPVQFRATERLALGAWKLEPGEELIYWMTVRDTKEPAANRFETPRRRIKVGQRFTPSRKGLGDRTGSQEKEQARAGADPDARPGVARAVPRDNAGLSDDRNGLERLPQSDHDSAKVTDVPDSEGHSVLRLTADDLRQLRRIQVLLGLDPSQPWARPNGASPDTNRSLPSDAGPERSTAAGDGTSGQSSGSEPRGGMSSPAGREGKNGGAAPATRAGEAGVAPDPTRPDVAGTPLQPEEQSNDAEDSGRTSQVLPAPSSGDDRADPNAKDRSNEEAQPAGGRNAADPKSPVDRESIPPGTTAGSRGTSDAGQGASPKQQSTQPRLARPGATELQDPRSGQNLAEGSASPGMRMRDDGRASTANSRNQETTNPNGEPQSPKTSQDAKPRENANRPGRESPRVDAPPVPSSDRTRDQNEPNTQSKTSTSMTNAASGTTESTRSSAPGRVPESRDDKKPQPNVQPSSDATRAPTPTAAPTSATTGETNEATKEERTNDDRGPRPVSEKPVRPAAKEEDSVVAQKKAGSRKEDRNRSEPEQKQYRSPKESKEKPEARPQPPEKPSPPPERSDSKDSPQPSARQATPKNQAVPKLENPMGVTPAPQFSPPGMDVAPPDPNRRERLPHPPGSNGDTYISKKKSQTKSASKTTPPSSQPPTKSSPKERGMGRRPRPDRTGERNGGKPVRSPSPAPNALKGMASASHEPAERGPGSASDGVRGGERAETVGGRDGPPARGNSGTNRPSKEHDAQGTPHQISASDGSQTVDGPRVQHSTSGMNQVPSDRDKASPGAEGESSNAPPFGDRSSSSVRSTGGNSGGGGTTPSGNRRQIPSVTGPTTSDSIKDPPRKLLSVTQAHPHDWSETVAPDVALMVPVLQKLEDLLRSNQIGPELERESGMSREQMEQFVTRFKPHHKAAPGQGRAVEASPSYERAFHDEPTSIALDGDSVGSLATRSSANVVVDQQSDIAEGIRFVVPSELRSGFEAYKSSISRSISTRP